MALSNLARFFQRSPWNIDDYPDMPVDRSLRDQDLNARFFDSDYYYPRYHSLLRPRVSIPPLFARLGEAKQDKDKFKVMVNVSQFKPNEVEVKVVDNYIVIHGKHEERHDEHGFVQREFTRRYLLPEGVDSETVKSALSKDGVLTIEAAKKAELAPNERVIPITVQTPGHSEGKPQ